MAKITIECADPNDLQALTAAAEQAAGRCTIIYAKRAKALVDAGACKSERAAARHIADETGEPIETVRSMIKRGNKKMGAGAPKTTQTDPKDPSILSRHIKNARMVSHADGFGTMAIAALKRIEKDDPAKWATLERVKQWIIDQQQKDFET